jgi:hypothetical protein
MQPFLERKTIVTDLTQKYVCKSHAAIALLERKTEVTDLIQKYVCKSHAAIPGKENRS